MTDDPYKWCRRIFASVDVVGSTAFKQRSPENSGKWATTFKLFFDEFPTQDAPSTTAQTASDTPDPKLPAHTEVDKDSFT
jgi:hypothetical protein